MAGETLPYELPLEEPVTYDFTQPGPVDLVPNPDLFGLDQPPELAPPANPGGEARAPAPAFSPEDQTLPPGGADAQGAPLFPWETPAALTPDPAPPAALARGAPGGADPAAPSVPQDEPLTYDFTDPDENSRALTAAGPEAVGASRVNLEQDRADFAREERRKAIAANEQAAAHNTEVLRIAQGRAQREIDDLQRQIRDNDRSHAWADRSMPQKIGAWIDALTHGLFEAYHGGRNAGLERVMQSLDNDVEMKRQALQGQLQTAGQGYQDAFQEFKAAEANRIANLGQLDKAIAAKAAEFDPAGTRAQLLAEERLKVRQEIAKKSQEAADRIHDKARQDADLELRRRSLQEQTRARYASQGEQRRQRELEAKKAGFLYDAKGNLVPDPAAKLDPTKDLARLRGERVAQELGHEDEERIVQGVKGRELGRARSKIAAENMRQRVASYDRYQTEITELANMLTNPDGSTKTVYQGPGWELMKNPERDAVMAKALNVLYLQAKINDPSTGVRDAEIEFGKKIVPFVQGLTSGRSPAAQADIIREQADTDLLSHMDAEIVGGAGQVPADANPVKNWRETRAAVSDARSLPVQADTPEKGLDLLIAPIAAGTPDVARKEFVKSKISILERWATDQPGLVDGLNIDGLKEKWATDKSLTKDDREKLGAALDQAQKSAAATKATQPGWRLSAPVAADDVEEE